MEGVIATLGQLKARIAREMDRDDLTSDIADGITRAINYYADERFAFTENIATVTTTANVEDVALPDGLEYEDHNGVFITVGGFKYQLEKISRVRLQYWQSTQNLVGQPVEYALETNKFRFFPTPNQAYTITVLGVYEIAAPATDDDSNAWTSTAEDLIAARVRYQLARDVTYDPQMVASAEIAMQEAYNNLKRKSARKMTDSTLEPNW